MSQDKKGSWEIGSFYLANGKRLAKENIDIPVLMNLSNVQRAFSFAGVPPSVNLNLTSHSYLTMLISYRLLVLCPEFKYTVRQDSLASFAMVHDIAEALVGDIPTPLKHPDFQKFEREVKMSIFEYLGVDSNEYDVYEDLIVMSDLLASLYECECATRRGYDLSLIYEARLTRFLSQFVIDREDFESLPVNSSFKYDTGKGRFLCYYIDETHGGLRFKISHNLATSLVEDIVGYSFGACGNINTGV